MRCVFSVLHMSQCNAIDRFDSCHRIQRNTFNAFPIFIIIICRHSLKLPINSCWCAVEFILVTFPFTWFVIENDVRVNRIDAACINALALCCCVMLMRWGTSTVIMRAQNETPSHEFFIAKMINVEWLQWLRWQPLPLAFYLCSLRGWERYESARKNEENKNV